MSGYDCRNRWVLSFWRNVVSDGTDWSSTGKLFQSRGPAAANERSPTVTIVATDGHRGDWRSTSAADLGVSTADRRRTEAGPIGRLLKCSAEKSSVDNDRQFELDALGCSKPVDLLTTNGFRFRYYFSYMTKSSPFTFWPYTPCLKKRANLFFFTFCLSNMNYITLRYIKL